VGWSEPVRLVTGRVWYPQVLGLGPPGFGTDREAGQRARFYMGGRSEHVIEFSWREGGGGAGSEATTARE